MRRFMLSMLLVACGDPPSAMSDATVDSSSECDFPKNGCSCDPSTDTICCTNSPNGLSCVGTAKPQWRPMTGCGCISDPACGVPVAPVCEGIN